MKYSVNKENTLVTSIPISWMYWSRFWEYLKNQSTSFSESTDLKPASNRVPVSHRCCAKTPSRWFLSQNFPQIGRETSFVVFDTRVAELDSGEVRLIFVGGQIPIKTIFTLLPCFERIGCLFLLSPYPPFQPFRFYITLNFGRPFSVSLETSLIRSEALSPNIQFEKIYSLILQLN